jgi:hypothetical protein
MFLQGRTAIYVKGRIQGKWIFENIQFTAHFDSAKRKEFEQIFRQVIDPERWYPVYGDTAREVKDINARDKLYLLVEFDASKFLIGNFKSQIEGVELFSYDRAFYGLQLDFKRAFVKGYDTGVKVFASRDGEIQQHAHVELRGTGGSIYYLKHEEVLEGSEKVRVVVRDRDTGMELFSTYRSRYSDYTVEYRQGRILLKSPLPSVADASFLVQNNLATVLNGHPIYLVVDYEYAGRLNESGNSVGCTSARRSTTSWRWAVVTCARADREHDPGLHALGRARQGREGWLFPEGRVRPVEGGRLQSYVSDDGGLTFQNLGNAWDKAQNRKASGSAYRVEAGGDLAKALGWKDRTVQVRAYVQGMESGFFASGKLQDQGATKYGMTVTLKPTQEDEVVLRHDAFTSELYDQGDLSRAARKSSRAVTTAQYTRKQGKLTLTGEYNHTFVTDDQLEGASLSDSVAAGFSYDLSKRIQLLARQEAFLRAGDRVSVASGQMSLQPQRPSLGDHLTTTVGARFALTDSTLLQVTETVRWSGENATAIGLKTKLTDTASLYVEERLLQRDSRVLGTTVVGGENKLGKQSRAYAEYQLDAGVEGRRNRAVLGAGHRFAIAKGMNIDLSYEVRMSSTVSAPRVASHPRVRTAACSPRRGYKTWPIAPRWPLRNLP